MQFNKFDRADSKYDTSVLNFRFKRAKTKHFWTAIKAFLIFDKILRVDKFKGAEFKYDNSVLKF